VAACLPLPRIVGADKPPSAPGGNRTGDLVADLCGILDHFDRKAERTMIETTLHHRVNSALEESAHLRGRQLRFEADRGRVTLRGVVHSYFQKQMAQEAIRNLDGVQEIANELEVGCW
jgi:hypothetical protein